MKLDKIIKIVGALREADVPIKEIWHTLIMEDLREKGVKIEMKDVMETVDTFDADGVPITVSKFKKGLKLEVEEE